MIKKAEMKFIVGSLLGAAYGAVFGLGIKFAFGYGWLVGFVVAVLSIAISKTAGRSFWSYYIANYLN
jgi:hypothetical protein